MDNEEERERETAGEAESGGNVRNREMRKVENMCRCKWRGVIMVKKKCSPSPHFNSTLFFFSLPLFYSESRDTGQKFGGRRDREREIRSLAKDIAVT